MVVVVVTASTGSQRRQMAAAAAVAVVLSPMKRSHHEQRMSANMPPYGVSLVHRKLEMNADTRMTETRVQCRGKSD